MTTTRQNNLEEHYLPATQFVNMLAATDVRPYEALLAEDSTMRIYGWQEMEAYRPRTLVGERLLAEWAAWPDAHVILLSSVSEGSNKTAVEFRIQATENGRYVEHNRAAFLTWADGHITTIELYCSAPVPSARREKWLAPATLSHEELNQLFDSQMYQFDPREGIPAPASGRMSLSRLHVGSGLPHPGANTVLGARWQPEEADAQIEALIAYHREREIGFSWLVGPFDTPVDLGERLVKHGLVLAGDQAIMARRGLENVDDMPTNPALHIEVIDGFDDALAETTLQIYATCFHWPAEQVEMRRPSFMEELQDAPKYKQINYLAWLDDEPAAVARLGLKGNTAHLSGAATLPGFRGQKIYSTLLKRRLEDAREYGHQIATIDAQPMSRRIVSRFGFQEFARSYMYAWMPVIDMEVIRSLVPTE